MYSNMGFRYHPSNRYAVQYTEKYVDILNRYYVYYEITYLLLGP